MEKFYITTAIYYVNAVPHLGSVSEAIAADVIARYKRLKGCDVFFSTGTDEHSQKIEMRAKEQGISPKEFVDRESATWKEIFDKVGISYNRFIRTSDDDHVKVVQNFFNVLYEKGDIYLGKYEGWYCVRDETFLKDADLDNGRCPHCGGDVQRVVEDNYFFKLSKYQESLLNLYENNKNFLRPESRYNEIINIIKSGLQDISVTRKSFKFGIPVPFDEEHTIYVWFDALINYVTSVGFLSDGDKFAKYWPADLHLIGKDITRFHGIVWPAMLMSYGLDLPKCIFAHGFWNLEGAKMSKSLGNVVDPIQFIEDFSKFASIDFQLAADVLRYYLSREVNFGLDGDFRVETFVGRYNADLANDYGNLINRTITMLKKYRQGRIPKEGQINTELVAFVSERRDAFFQNMELYQLNLALDEVWALIAYLNNYIQQRSPWNLLGKPDELDSVLYELLEGIRIATVMIRPFMPNCTAKVLETLGCPDQDFSSLEWGVLRSGLYVGELLPLFPRVDKERIEASTVGGGQEKKDNGFENVISYDDFAKVSLKVAKVERAEKVKNSDKLLKITVKIGEECRVIVAGIGKHYSPEELEGKKVVVVTNLEPRKLMGIESYGMLLAASNDEKLTLLTVDRDIEEGSKIR